MLILFCVIEIGYFTSVCLSLIWLGLFRSGSNFFEFFCLLWFLKIGQMCESSNLMLMYNVNICVIECFISVIVYSVVSDLFCFVSCLFFKSLLYENRQLILKLVSNEIDGHRADEVANSEMLNLLMYDNVFEFPMSLIYNKIFLMHLLEIFSVQPTNHLKLICLWKSI